MNNSDIFSTWGVHPSPRCPELRLEGELLPSGWGLTHRSFLPLGFGFPSRARSSSSVGCLYRKRLRAKTGSQESLGMEGSRQ